MFLYNILLILILIAYVPHLTIRGKWHKGLLIQLGFFPQGFELNLKHSANIWIHAVSVGEVLVTEGIIKQLKQKYPQHQIILSTVTRTGNNLARQKFGNEVKVIFAPFDFSWVVRKFLAVIDPVIYIAAETEIWPNLYRKLNEKGVKILQINGRISDGSFKGYQKIKFFVSRTLSKVERFAMQSDLDRDRICNLGADPSKVEVIGNLKFDNVQEMEVLDRNAFGFDEDDIVWVSGSTHPGEEKVVLDVYKLLKTKYKNLKLILAPRHIERVNEVCRILGDYFFNVVRLSERSTQAPDILLVDTIGHLRQMYSLADFVFVGKTLLGIGGQNILEPAFYAKPIIVGPHMENFKSIAALFDEQNALLTVNNQNELLKEVERLILNQNVRERYGLLANKIIQENKGATLRTVNLISQYI